MFSKHRNIIAWVLLLLAAVLWTLGQAVIQDVYPDSGPTMPTTAPMNSTAATTFPATEHTAEPTINPTTEGTHDPGRDTRPSDSRNTGFVVEPQQSTPTDYRDDPPITHTWGFILCLGAVLAAVLSVFVLWQRAPLFGPDGAALLLILPFLLQLRDASMPEYLILNFLAAVVVLTAARELWGWIYSSLNLEWCISFRLARSLPQPQYTLLVQCGWICVCAVLAVFTVCRYYYVVHPMVWLMPTVSGCLGILCLWKYGSDLGHYEKQLQNFQNGLSITIRDGAFQDAEALLQQIQQQHEEAVRTAVTSERFKVELISNVSHDLRTPLTSILGYGELLQKESLSPAGQEQLHRLNQKAGYMRDLVESLFELTKVSSGVIEAKKEEIDLVRLLEQTIGLFDDQLTDAGLLVRRHYDSDTIPIITDGARMHQVFANLLGNAIKYALTGTRIFLEVREAEGSHLIRMVNTSSYEMDFRPDEIMQRFARGDKARSTKGSGLGLAIAQTYTESVGGQFRVAVDGDQFSAIVELPKN